MSDRRSRAVGRGACAADVSDVGVTYSQPIVCWPLKQTAVSCKSLIQVLAKNYGRL